MKEEIKFVITKQGLQLQFQTVATMRSFIKDMKELEIDFFNKGSGTSCDIKAYSEKNPYGFFLSREGRVGLSFPSEKHKFLFIERVGLDSTCFMDMGPGYDDQIHFNENKLPCALKASIIAVREIEEAQRSSFTLR